MGYSLLADVIVVIHLAYVAFVVLGQAAILLGAALSWGWIRNLYFRLAHLGAIALVAAEALLGIVCPLTRWENQLRRLAGESVDGQSFVARWTHAVLFYRWPEHIFTTIYVAFAAAVLLTLWFVPPRMQTRGETRFHGGAWLIACHRFR